MRTFFQPYLHSCIIHSNIHFEEMKSLSWIFRLKWFFDRRLLKTSPSNHGNFVMFNMFWLFHALFYFLFICSFFHSFIHLFILMKQKSLQFLNIYVLIISCFILFVYSFICSFMHSFVHLFILMGVLTKLGASLCCTFSTLLILHHFSFVSIVTYLCFYIICMYNLIYEEKLCK